MIIYDIKLVLLFFFNAGKQLILLPKQETGLAHTGVPNEKQFEEVIILGVHCGHYMLGLLIIYLNLKY